MDKVIIGITIGVTGDEFRDIARHDPCYFSRAERERIALIVTEELKERMPGLLEMAALRVWGGKEENDG